MTDSRPERTHAAALDGLRGFAKLVSARVWHRNAPAGAIPGMSQPKIAAMRLGSVLRVRSARAIPDFARFIGGRVGTLLGRISCSVCLLHRPLRTLLAPHVLVPTLLAGKLIEVRA